jgi:hypothetical protein
MFDRQMGKDRSVGFGPATAAPLACHWLSNTSVRFSPIFGTKALRAEHSNI